MNKLGWGIVALSLVLAGVTVYAYNFHTQINSLSQQIAEKDDIIKENEETITTLRAKSLEGKVVKIGYISSSTKGLETAKPYLEQIIVPDMNAYCKQMGKNVTFQFQIEDAEGQASTHLDKVFKFNNQGISVFIGGLWSSQASGSLNYVDTNHMLMLSPSSTSPTLAFARDRLFRMYPADIYTVPALVEMLWSYGIRHVCFVQRGDGWGDGIKNLFEPAWKEKGGDFTNPIVKIEWGSQYRWVLEPIRYNVTSSDFSEYLAIAEQQILEAREKYSAESIGGILLSFEEASKILSQAKNYPNVYSTKWFGADSTAKSSSIRDKVPDEACQMKLYSLLPSKQDNRQYQALERRYTAITGLPLTDYGSLDSYNDPKNAYLYDTAMIIMKAMLLADSSKADDIVNLLQPLCDNYYGVTGSCSLNTAGDRVPPPYDIWGYGFVDGKVEFVRYGEVDPVAGKVSWDTS